MDNIEIFRQKWELVNREEIPAATTEDDLAASECDIYEFFGVEDEEDLEDEIVGIAEGRDDEN